jgi:hypothetical protein
LKNLFNKVEVEEVEQHGNGWCCKDFQPVMFNPKGTKVYKHAWYGDSSTYCAIVESKPYGED